MPPSGGRRLSFCLRRYRDTTGYVGMNNATRRNGIGRFIPPLAAGKGHHHEFAHGKILARAIASHLQRNKAGDAQAILGNRENGDE